MLRKDGVASMIVPISVTSSDSLSGLHQLLFANCGDIYLSSYAVRPKPVFENAMVNTSILSLRKTLSASKKIYATKMYRRGKDFNPQQLLDNLSFVEVSKYLLYGRIPKIGTTEEQTILKKLSEHKRLREFIRGKGSPIVYRFAGGRYFKVITPYRNNSSAERVLYFDKAYSSAIGAILSSSLSFWFYQIYSDNLNWKSYEIEEFRIPNLGDQDCKALSTLYNEYLEDIERNVEVRETTGSSGYNITSFKNYRIGKSKHIIDKIDDYIGPLYGLTCEEIKFIKEYEIKFRLDDNE